jgi:hypothetical protein
MIETTNKAIRIMIFINVVEIKLVGENFLVTWKDSSIVSFSCSLVVL